MYKFKFLFILVAVLSLFVVPDATAQKNFYDGFSGADTLANADTSLYTSSHYFKDLGVMEFHVAIDSISGTTAGTISYQYSLSPAATEWHTIGTDTVTDADDQSHVHQLTNFAAARVRIQLITTGTQSTRAVPYISFREN